MSEQGAASVFRTVRIKVPRHMVCEPISQKIVLSPEGAVETIRAFMEREKTPMDREVFGVLFLNQRGYPVGAEIVSIGGIAETMAHPREVFKGAILAGAVSIITWHTHPSGGDEWSTSDVLVGQRLKLAGEILAIPLVDNFVLTAKTYRRIPTEIKPVEFEGFRRIGD